ncbi:DUF2379 family protein [Pyxidicoccus trucidator]
MDEGTMALLREASRRTANGSNRLTDALHRMWSRQKADDTGLRTWPP